MFFSPKERYGAIQRHQQEHEIPDTRNPEWCLWGTTEGEFKKLFGMKKLEYQTGLRLDDLDRVVTI